MIEMLGVLAIIGVLSVGGIAGYSKAMMKFKINKTIDQIAMTVTNIRTLYAQQITYSGLADTNAYDMGIVDDAMVAVSTKGSNKLKNPFGNAADTVFIKSAKSGAAGEDKTAGSTTDNRAFVVVFKSLPREACVAIATNDWGSGYSSGLLGIGVTAVKDAEGARKVYEPICNVVGGTTLSAASGKDGNTANVTIGDSKLCVTSSAPVFTVATAASGCDCASGDAANNCIVSLKYY